MIYCFIFESKETSDVKIALCVLIPTMRVRTVLGLPAVMAVSTHAWSVYEYYLISYGNNS